MEINGDLSPVGVLAFHSFLTVVAFHTLVLLGPFSL